MTGRKLVTFRLQRHTTANRVITLRFIFGLLQKMLEKYFSAWKKCFVCLHKCFLARNKNVFQYGISMFFQLDTNFFRNRTKMFFRFDTNVFPVRHKKHFCSMPKNIFLSNRRNIFLPCQKTLLFHAEKQFCVNLRKYFFHAKKYFFYIFCNKPKNIFYPVVKILFPTFKKIIV